MNYLKNNLFLILISIGLISLLSSLTYASMQNAHSEKEKIDTFFDNFENLNQNKTKDTLKPKIVTYSQLKNFNENDNYIHNRRDITKRVTIYSRINKKLPKNKHYDVSSRVTTYSELNNSKKQKKYDVSKLVTVYKEPNKET